MEIVPEKAQIIVKAIKEEFEDISYALDERRKRLWCAAKVRAYNKIHWKRGVTLVHKATQISRLTIYAGLKELESEEKLDKKQIRQQGGGRQKITSKSHQILWELEKLIEPLTRGDPESPLRWTCKSTYKGLKIQAKLDENIYEKGKKITDGQLSAIALEQSEFHGEWNYHSSGSLGRREIGIAWKNLL